jgi:hypothetical protein
MMRRFQWLCAGLWLAASANAASAGNWAIDGFCREVQRVTAESRVNAELVIHATSGAYRASKPGIEPVIIHQYVTADAAGRPKMISCKVKTADHLIAAYGPSAAGRQGSCEQVTRNIVDQAIARAGPGAPRLVIEPEQQVWTGSDYLGPFELLTQDAEGVLHVNTRYMRIDWGDWRWYLFPNRLRGHLYCHVIAPEYIARLLAGEQPDLQPIEIPTSPDAGWSWRRPFG